MAHDGGYAGMVRVPADWVVPLPPGLTLFEAMAIGTAGYTSALAIHLLEHNGMAPANGKVLVNGATGGCASIAIDMLARLGYRVTAITGKAAEHDYLKRIGASEVLGREVLAAATRPLEKGLWAAAFDSVGGEQLAALTRTMQQHGLIASTDVVNKNEDSNQFASQVNQANEVLGKKCETACADAGYSHAADLKQIDSQAIKVIVPTQRQALRAPTKQPNRFDKTNFIYDKDNDCYICQEGYTLHRKSTLKDRGYKEYMVSRGKNNPCKTCSKFGVCTKSQDGRKVTRLLDEELREKLEAVFDEPDSQAIYKLRKQKAEHPFGHIKRNLGMNTFLLRGLSGVKAEMSLLASCFNIRRMLTIIGGVEPLISQLKDQKEVMVSPLRLVGTLA